MGQLMIFLFCDAAKNAILGRESYGIFGTHLDMLAHLHEKYWKIRWPYIILVGIIDSCTRLLYFQRSDFDSSSIKVILIFGIC